MLVEPDIDDVGEIGDKTYEDQGSMWTMAQTVDRDARRCSNEIVLNDNYSSNDDWAFNSQCPQHEVVGVIKYALTM